MIDCDAEAGRLHSQAVDYPPPDLAREILDGRRTRTVNPFKLRNLLERV
jgi:hypothetical protein